MSLTEFEIGKELGRGAFSSVYLVRRKEDNKIYAMKRVKIVGLGKKEKNNVFNEVRLLASINHKNIIGYNEAFYDNKSETLNIILEYADGGDLSTKIKQNSKKHIFFDEMTIWKTLIQILEGLKYLHKNCIIHRDLKSANIFLTKNGFVKIGDLNVSKIIKSIGMACTQTGTPYFAAPEIWNNKPYDYKCDIWSAGCIIYEMAVLKIPFRGATMKQLYSNVMKGIYPSIPNRYSEDLKKIIKKILVVNPKNRPSASSLLNCSIIKQKINEYEFFFGNENSMDFIDDDENPELINTIKIPGNMNMINKELPKKRYEDEKRKNLDDIILNDTYDDDSKKEMFCPPQNKKKQCGKNNGKCINNYMNQMIIIKNKKKRNNIDNNKDLILNDYSELDIPYKILLNNKRVLENVNNKFVNNTSNDINKNINTRERIIKNNNVTNLFNNNIIIVNNTNGSIEGNNNYKSNKNSASNINIRKKHKKLNMNYENSDNNLINNNFIQNNQNYSINDYNNNINSKNNNKIRCDFLNTEESSIPFAHNYYTIDAIKSINDQNYSNKIMNDIGALNSKSISQNTSNKKYTNTSIKRTNISNKKYLDKRSYSIDNLRKKNPYPNNYNKNYSNITKQKRKVVDKINNNIINNNNKRYSKHQCQNLTDIYYEVLNQINDYNLKEKFAEKNRIKSTQIRRMNTYGNIKNNNYNTYDMEDNIDNGQNYFKKHIKNSSNIKISYLKHNNSSRDHNGKNRIYSAENVHSNNNRSYNSNSCINNRCNNNILLSNKNIDNNNNNNKTISIEKRVNNNYVNVNYNNNTIQNDSHRKYLILDNNTKDSNKISKIIRNNSTSNHQIKKLSDDYFLFDDININNSKMQNNIEYNSTVSNTRINTIETSKDYNTSRSNRNIKKKNQNSKQYYNDYYNNYLNDISSKKNQKNNLIEQNKHSLNYFNVSNIDNNIFNNEDSKIIYERGNMYNKKNEQKFTREPQQEKYKGKGNYYNQFNKIIARSNIGSESGRRIRKFKIQNFRINGFNNNNDPRVIIQKK